MFVCMCVCVCVCVNFSSRQATAGRSFCHIKNVKFKLAPTGISTHKSHDLKEILNTERVFSHLGKRLDCVKFSDLSGTSATRLVEGVFLPIVEKELGERNFGFDS